MQGRSRLSGAPLLLHLPLSSRLQQAQNREYHPFGSPWWGFSKSLSNCLLLHWSPFIPYWHSLLLLQLRLALRMNGGVKSIILLSRIADKHYSHGYIQILLNFSLSRTLFKVLLHFLKKVWLSDLSAPQGGRPPVLLWFISISNNVGQIFASGQRHLWAQANSY